VAGKSYNLLDRVHCPADIRDFSIEELRELCAQIRACIVETCAHNPGHLASSLGAVELIVGMHYVFDTPKDKIIFDVGHQAYAHKILTGRRDLFEQSLREEGGLSGFPKRDESEYDCFGAGHSSTSISAALGFAEAQKLLRSKDKVVCLIGDGAMSGGLAFEGMNNAGASNADLLIILNDNNRSIDDNIGAMHEYLLRVSTDSSYNKFKTRVWNRLGEGQTRAFLQRWLRSLKSWFVKKSGGDLFEALGFRYFGPIDGNDIGKVISTLTKLRDMHGPRILHCNTVKGKGYSFAESDPATWHAPGRFVPETGERTASTHTKDRYQDVFGAVLCSLAEKDKRVVGITPAMAQGSGMSGFAARFPEQFFDVGIEEEHAVTFAAGLAAAGLKPFCNIYSSFAQRAYDEIVHDVALQSLPVVLCFDRAGLVGEDGATHHGVFDLSALRCIPNLIISSPRNEQELKNLMYSAYGETNRPYIIRYPRGMGEGTPWKDTEAKIIPTGKGETLLEGSEVAIIGLGPTVNRALEAAKECESGSAGVYDFRFLKPLDEELLRRIASSYKHILTLEDGSIKGGLYGAVCEFVAAEGVKIPVEGIGVGDEFIGQGRQTAQYARCEMDCEGIKKRLQKVFAEKK